MADWAAPQLGKVSLAAHPPHHDQDKDLQGDAGIQPSLCPALGLCLVGTSRIQPPHPHHQLSLPPQTAEMESLASLGHEQMQLNF